ncbi:hypothetical protein BJV77DRAFT_991909, partial [Russula vinacea]
MRTRENVRCLETTSSLLRSVGWCTRRSIGDGRMAEARRNGRQTHRDRSTIY